MIRRPPRSTQGVSSAASDVYKRQVVFECAAMCVHFELIEDSREVFIHVRLVKFDMVQTEATQYRLEKKAVNVIEILHQ